MEASDASDVAGDGTGDASDDTDMADAGEKASSDSASSQELIFGFGSVYKCILLQFTAAAFLQSFSLSPRIYVEEEQLQHQSTLGRSLNPPKKCFSLAHTLTTEEERIHLFFFLSFLPAAAVRERGKKERPKADEG